jgi:4-hydroxy-tetrahydrodipicolinate reductase
VPIVIRVGVIGAYGKMGREVARAVMEDPETVLVAAVDQQGVGESVGSLVGHAEEKVRISDELAILSDAATEVAVDFTHPKEVMDNIRWCVRNAINVVVGTTGITPADLDEVRQLIEEEGHESNVFIAPNFAIGAVLMMRFAEIASTFLPDVEIIELHHDQKADAPSGTALKTAETVIRNRGEAVRRSRPSEESIPGVRGGEVDGIRIHSVRLPGLVAHQEVLLGGPGQTLTIRHDSYDRASFMPGVLTAIKEISHHPGLTYGLEEILDI